MPNWVARYQRRDVAPLADLLKAASAYKRLKGHAAFRQRLSELANCETETAVLPGLRDFVIRSFEKDLSRSIVG